MTRDDPGWSRPGTAGRRERRSGAFANHVWRRGENIYPGKNALPLWKGGRAGKVGGAKGRRVYSFYERNPERIAIDEAGLRAPIGT